MTKEEIKNFKNPYDDIDENHWYYEEVIKAIYGRRVY